MSPHCVLGSHSHVRLQTRSLQEGSSGQAGRHWLAKRRVGGTAFSGCRDDMCGREQADFQLCSSHMDCSREGRRRDIRGEATKGLVQHEEFGLLPVGAQGPLEEVFWFVARRASVTTFICLKIHTLGVSRKLQ